jgi:hypothetical protein
MKLTEQQHDECIATVDGGCSQSIEELYQTLLEEIGISWDSLDYEDHTYIDERIFNCEVCNWTYPIGCMGEWQDGIERDDWVCQECVDEYCGEDN